MSGGQQQMLAIGRALMASPLLLMMDEPSLGLAPLLVSQLFDLIAQINRMGMTILLVEQNAVASLKIAHRAYVLESGKIALTGAAKDMMNDPRVREVYLGL
jgi:branched-chain amino acid transport system ATP-binding protein